jgi:phosphoribosylformylglycinamidine (FGAM) synthase PurS component
MAETLLSNPVIEDFEVHVEGSSEGSGRHRA